MAPSVARGVTTKTVDGAHPATDQQGENAGSTLALRVWLTVVLLLVVGMVLVGGATRLTDSGLSITEWQPLLGAIPPLTDADWHAAFEKYKLIPEYTQVNEGMSLAAFKAIFWWEWAHRFLGRFIGLAFALPLAWFWVRGAIPKGWHLRLLGVLVLGGIQGFVGWVYGQVRPCRSRRRQPVPSRPALVGRFSDPRRPDLVHPRSRPAVVRDLSARRTGWHDGYRRHHRIARLPAGPRSARSLPAPRPGQPTTPGR